MITALISDNKLILPYLRNPWDNECLRWSISLQNAV